MKLETFFRSVAYLLKKNCSPLFQFLPPSAGVSIVVADPPGLLLSNGVLFGVLAASNP